MRVAQINADGYCYAVSEISGSIVPSGAIEITKEENPLGRIKNQNGTWSESVYSTSGYDLTTAMNDTQALGQILLKQAELEQKLDAIGIMLVPEIPEV